jgi:hypothetical protein
MALRVAKFKSEDGKGFVAYDSTTMYVYPVLFRTRSDLDHFNAWLQNATGYPINGYDGNDLYSVYVRWIEEGKRVIPD